MAKTEKVCNEMMERLEELQVEGNVYTWRAFCIDTKKVPDGQTAFSLQQFIGSMPWIYYDIYGEKLCAEYSKKVYSPIQIVRMQKNLYCRPVEGHSEYWNFDEKGRRYTIGQPLNAEKVLHFFGDSRILGIGVEDKETIPSFLQKRINEVGLFVKVENYSLSDTSIDNLFEWMKDSELQEGDIVCFSCDFIKLNEDCAHLFDKMDGDDYYIHWLKKIMKYCSDKNVQFNYIMTGGIESCGFANKTLAEKTIVSSVQIGHSNVFYIPRNRERLLEYVDIAGGGVLDTRRVLREVHEKISCFVDTGHYSPKANKVVAESIFRLVFERNKQELYEKEMELIDEYLIDTRRERVFRFLWTETWRKYKEELQKGKVNVSKSGAIVMNANPFTKGHRYLIEYAAKKVEHLYVFVLEEDCSFFSFQDRIQLVKEGTKDLQNVTIFRGGEFIISKKTFPEYFDKADSVANSSRDIEIFATLIAPILGITCRFVGKEPYSVVTNGYNEQMKKMLPEFGISLVEIERTDVDGEIISATKVRKACENKDIETLRAMLPATTFDFVRDKCLLGEV